MADSEPLSTALSAKSEPLWTASAAKFEPLSTAFEADTEPLSTALSANNEPLVTELAAAVLAKVSAFDCALEADTEPLSTALSIPISNDAVCKFSDSEVKFSDSIEESKEAVVFSILKIDKLIEAVSAFNLFILLFTSASCKVLSLSFRLPPSNDFVFSTITGIKLLFIS